MIQLSNVFLKDNAIELLFDVDGTPHIYKVLAEKQQVTNVTNLPAVALPQVVPATSVEDGDIVQDFRTTHTVYANGIRTALLFKSSDLTSPHQYRLKKSGESWSDWQDAPNLQHVTPPQIPIHTLAYASEYEAQIRVADKESKIYTFTTPKARGTSTTEIQGIYYDNLSHTNANIWVYPELLDISVKATFVYRQARDSRGNKINGGWVSEELRVPIDAITGKPIIQNNRYLHYLTTKVENMGKTYEFYVTLNGKPSDVYEITFADHIVVAGTETARSGSLTKLTPVRKVTKDDLTYVNSGAQYSGPSYYETTYMLPETLVLSTHKITAKSNNTATLQFWIDRVKLKDITVEYRPLSGADDDPPRITAPQWRSATPFQYGQYYAELRSIKPGVRYEFRVRTNAAATSAYQFQC